MNIYKEKIEIAVVAPPFSGHLYPALELVLPLLKGKGQIQYLYLYRLSKRGSCKETWISCKSFS